jgi:predicted dehydrogenase
MNEVKLRVAVVGAGAFGRNHLRIVRDAEVAQLAGVFDIDAERRAAAASEFACRELKSLDEVRGAADAAIIAAPTTMHCSIACALMQAGLDVLVEKPIAGSVKEAHRMVDTALARGRILQIGHLERFNPAVAAAEHVLTMPLFFEVHRLSVFSPRSLDVDVVMDLMVHDLEIVLAMTAQMPSEVRAAGISVLSDKVDIANVRLSFPNGCVANLTASRVSTERVRKLRLFQPSQYVSIDYSKQDLLVISVDEQRQVRILPQAVQKQEPLKAQLEAFVHCVRTRATPKVSGGEGLRALEVAEIILDKIKVHAAVVARSLAAREAGSHGTS